MQPGNLVKITRASIGIPNGTIGLILKVYPGAGPLAGDLADIQIYIFYLLDNFRLLDQYQKD